MHDDYPAGSRVRVRRDRDYGPGPWPDEPTGTVIGASETVETTRGPMAMYWVRFDEPQYDPDGDGPYDRSQVLARYLEPMARE